MIVQKCKDLIFEPETATSQFKEQITLQRGLKRAIYQIEDGVIVNKFNTIREAGKVTGITWQLISKVLRGKKRTTGGFEWKYA